MSDNWEGRPIWIDPIGNQYRDMHPVSTHWVRYVPHSEAAAEIARLRAEVERLTAALSDERAHADALAETLDATMLAYSEPDRRFCCNGHMCGCRGSTVREVADHYATEALEAHRARRQG